MSDPTNFTQDLNVRVSRLENTIEEQAELISRLQNQVAELEVTSSGSGYSIDSGVDEFGTFGNDF